MKRNIKNIHTPLLGINIYILEKTGLLHSKQNYINVLGIINNVFLILFIPAALADCFQELFVKKDVEINLILTNLRFTCIGFITSIKLNTFIKWRKSWKIVFEYVNQCDFEERKHCDPFRTEIVQRYTKYDKMLTCGYFILSICTCATITITTIVLIFFKDEMSEFPHLFSMWVPFDKNSSPQCWILFIWSICLLYYVGFVVSIYDTTIFVIMNFLEKKLELMQYECSLIYNFGDEIISDQEFVEKVRICHDGHNQYTKSVKYVLSILPLYIHSNQKLFREFIEAYTY